MSQFFPLSISKIENTSEDSVVLTFDIHSELVKSFLFKAGQYITISCNIHGEEIRRAYSLCSAPNEKYIAVGVKKVQGGKMSTFLNEQVKVGDVLQVMPPLGNFILSTDSAYNHHYVGLCAGSGITPILSMIKQVMLEEKESSFTLIYGNRTTESTMFKEELKHLLADHSDRFEVLYAFSREVVSDSIYGRLDKENVQQIISTRPKLKNATAYFLCGPGEMIDQLNELLLLFNVPKSNIYFERFTGSSKITDSQDLDMLSDVTVIIDGEEFDFQLHSNDDTILDAAMDQGADVPFSCKGAVCCTCKAKVLEGKVRMDQNYSLSEDEVENGFILSCQAHPESDKVVIDFDVI